MIIPFDITAKKSLKEKIITERVDKEKEEVDYAVRVAQQEYEIVKKLAMNSLLKKKKLILLIRSSQHMKDNCIFFDTECRRIYGMSLVYLKSELKESTTDVSKMEKQLKESYNRLEMLKKKLERLEKGFVFKKESNFVKAVIPELKDAFKCVKKRGWNTARGIFVKPDSINDMPFPVFVKDVIDLNSGSKMIIVEAGSYDLNFSYVKKPLKNRGEVVKMGESIFSGASGNPVESNTVLIFISKDGKFLNPSFMCQ
jgi:hypothetical protein